MSTHTVAKHKSAFSVYVSRMSEFKREDWYVYVVWVGLLFGLLFSVSAFVLWGHFHGVSYPSYVWNIPIGAVIFTAAVAVDTIGHRTIYKEALQQGENLVHHMTIFAGITSVLALCLGYEHPSFFRVPIFVLTGLSVVYSLVDEALHWHRYMTKNSDVVEMWSHFSILLGHMLMMVAWIWWYLDGYPGVAETLSSFR